MVEVFKTNVHDRRTADELVIKLQSALPACRINFDLEDCDRILRVEGDSFSSNEIITHITTSGFNCEYLN